MDPKTWSAESAVSSAFACKYAVTGNEEFKREALNHLERAEKLAKPGDVNFNEMKDRIAYRLQTKEIISREEFLRRVSEKKEAGTQP